MRNLKNYGVLEMDAKNMRETVGGGRFVKLVGSIIGRITEYYYRGGDANHTWG